MMKLLVLVLCTGLISNSAPAATTTAQDCSTFEAMEKFYDLVQVIRNGNLMSVKRFVDEGACVNEITYGGLSVQTVPVVEAALYGYKDIAEYLVQHGADINKVEILGAQAGTMSALQAATAWDRAPYLINYLLAAGAEVNVGSEKMLYRTPLANAARSGNETIFKLLLEHGAKVNGFELLDVGNSFVVKSQAITPFIASELIARGAQVKIADWVKNTPLHLTRNAEIIRLLLANGADLNVENAFGETPVFGASYRDASGGQNFERDNNCESAEVFTKVGADYSHRNKFGRTPFLQLASQGGIHTTPDQLLEGEACAMLTILQNVKDTDVNLADPETGLTPLMYAASWFALDYSNYKEKLLRLMIEKGADVNAKDKAGNTVLSFATDSKIKKILMAAGAR